MIALLLLSASLLQAAPAARARQVFDWLLKGDYAAAHAAFTDEMKKALPADVLPAAMRQIHAMGALKAVLAPELAQVQGMTVVVLPAEFERAAINFQVTINQAGQVAGMYFRPRTASSAPWQAPPYARAGRFRAEEVTAGAGEWKLPGTLALPNGEGPFPGVVLVHGSGPNDRDETLGPNKPFRDLAEGLASRGIAVLRYEKRTRQYPAKLMALKSLTINEETVEDASAAVALLRGRPEIDPKRVFVLGHSLGGYIAPRIAKAQPQPSGIIIMAGSTRAVEDIVVEQVAYLASLSETPSEAQTKQVEALKAAAERTRSLKPGADVPASELLFNTPAAYWLDLHRYNPVREASALTMPVLVLQGERDYQATMEDFAGWKKAFAGHKNATLRSYPDLNHLFQAGEGKSKPAEYQKAGHVAPEVIDDVAKWVLSAR